MIPARCKKIKNYDKVIFSGKLGWFSTRKLIHGSHHVEIIQRRKTSMTKPVCAGETFDRLIFTYHNTFQQTRQAFSQLSKNLYEKTCSQLKWEPGCLPLWSVTRQRCPIHSDGQVDSKNWWKSKGPRIADTIWQNKVGGLTDSSFIIKLMKLRQSDKDR